MSTPHANTGAVGIPGLQTGEDVKSISSIHAAITSMRFEFALRAVNTATNARVLLTCPMCSSLLKSRPRALHWAFDSRTLRNGCSHRLFQNSMNTSMDLINSVLEGL